MEYRRKYFIAIIVAIVALIIILVVGNFFKNSKSREDKDQSYVGNYAQKVNDRNYDIMYFGGDLGLPENFRARKIFNFEDYSIESSDAPAGHIGHIIILYDPADEYYLTAEQAEQLRNLYETRSFRIIAVGSGKIRVLETVGLCSAGSADRYTSLMLWKDASGDPSIQAGIADHKELVPVSVEQQIDAKCIPAYSMLIELGSKDIYWT